MEAIIIVLGILILGAITYLILLQNRGKSNASQNILDELSRLKEDFRSRQEEDKRNVQSSLDKVSERLDSTLKFSAKSSQEQGKQIGELIQNIVKELTEVKQSSKELINYSSQLHELQQILKNPKQRGVLGEYWLETLLGNVLPSKQLYSMQHTIGETADHKKLIADAVVFIDKQVVPIDAKFSLENFNRMMAEQSPTEKDKLEKTFKSDVKKRIDETAKYIRPDLGTTNFAFMFIPAEGVFYNLLNADVGSNVNSINLIEYAFEKQVMIVSPTSFYAYLQTVLLGLKKLEIEKSTQEIIKRVSELGKHFTLYSDIHDRLGKNLTTVVNQYNQSSGELKKVSKDVIRITDGSREDVIELDLIEKPSE